jgi:hypothetical protein
MAQNYPEELLAENHNLEALLVVYSIK